MKKRINVTPVLFLLVLGLAACNLGNGAEIYVSPDGDDSNDCRSPQRACLTIQAAIDKSEVDGTIHVAGGTFESFTVESEDGTDRHLHIQGEGPGLTYVTGLYTHTVIRNTETTVIDSMTIMQGVDGIYNRAGYLVINNAEIIGNKYLGVYSFQNGDVTITNSLIADTFDEPGSGIQMIGGTLNIANTTITRNEAVLGGGILGGFPDRGAIIAGDCPEITIRNSTITDNRALSEDEIGAGGGIWACGNLSIFDTTISDNIATYGGGIQLVEMDVANPLLLIVGSTLSGNRAESSGGAVWTEQGTIVMTNSTVSGNGAAHVGGIYKTATVAWGGSVSIGYSTITANNSFGGAGGLQIDDANEQNTVIYASIITDNNGAYNCGALYHSDGHNMERGESCGFTAATDHPHTDPLLGPLADNGGPTQTHELLFGSPAVDRAGRGDCPDADQRGVARPNGFSCDTGAFESEWPSQATASGAAGLPTETPSPDPSSQPTEAGPTVSTDTDTNCRSGPSTAYEAVASLGAGQTATINGRIADNTWWRINLLSGSPCWVSDAIVVITGDTSEIPIYEPPPLPTRTPTLTPVPLDAPTPISPSGTLNCASASGGVTLDWSEISHPSGIDYFEWVLEGPISDGGTTPNSAATTVSLSCAGANYQWRVRAVNGQGTIGPWSAYLSFTIP